MNNYNFTDFAIGIAIAWMVVPLLFGIVSPWLRRVANEAIVLILMTKHSMIVGMRLEADKANVMHDMPEWYLNELDRQGKVFENYDSLNLVPLKHRQMVLIARIELGRRITERQAAGEPEV